MRQDQQSEPGEANRGSYDERLEDRVPFLARLEGDDRAALLELGRELGFAPRVALLHQHEPSSHVLLPGPGMDRR